MKVVISPRVFALELSEREMNIIRDALGDYTQDEWESIGSVGSYQESCDLYDEFHEELDV